MPASSSTQPTRRYQTRQREQILACLAERPGEYLTARQIEQLTEAGGQRVGTATLYRNLERLVEEGTLTTSVSDDGRTTCYRLVEQDSQGAADTERTHFYLRCEQCGGMTPVECRELESFYDHFAAEHHVLIDPVRTVLYGTCEQCLRESEQGAGEATSSGAVEAGAAGDTQAAGGAQGSGGTQRSGGAGSSTDSSDEGRA